MKCGNCTKLKNKIKELENTLYLLADVETGKCKSKQIAIKGMLDYELNKHRRLKHES